MLTNKCPNCGSYNTEDAADCYFCKQPLPGAKKGRKKETKKESVNTVMLTPAGAQRKWTEEKRPIGVTLLAVLSFAFGIYTVTSGMCLITSNDAGVMALINGSPYGFFGYLLINLFSIFNVNLLALVKNDFIYVVLIYLACSVVGLAVGWGLWNMKQWMRILIMVLQATFVVAVFILPDNPAFAFFQKGLMPGPGLFDIIRVSSTVIGIAIYIYVFVWLLLGERQFHK